MRNIGPLISGAILIFSSLLSNAQEKEEMDPVTITSTISEKKISQTGRNLIIIKGERFSQLPVHSIDELLRYLPGIEVQSRGPFGAQSDIVIRGGTFQQVLVILDGVRLNDPNTGHFTSYIPIAPSEIDRIEILKGASSAIYGSEAVGGVIHIITKSFSKTKRSPEAIAEFTGGQYDLYTINAGGTYTSENTTISGGLLSNNTKGQPQRGINGFVNNNTISLSIAEKIKDKWQLSFRSSFDNRKFAAQNFYTNFISDTANEKVKTFWNQLQVTYTTKKDILTLNAGYKNLEDRYAFSSNITPNQNKSNLIQGLITDEWKVTNKVTFVSGLQFISKQISSNDRGDHKVDQAATFAILNAQISEHFFISPALRLDWNQISGWQLVPQANLSWQDEKFQLRGSVGKTIRDADFTERYNNYNKTFVKSGSIGNPDLVSEKSLSYEAGADYFITGQIKISGTFFQRFYRDLIDFVNTPYEDIPRKSNLSLTGTYAFAKNISKVTTTGWETDLQYLLQLNKNDHLWATLGFTWLQSQSSSGTPS
ncbi:MAG: TonB-dependent receptor plug domain-containing protein, partial [Flavisolibacter sp.]